MSAETMLREALDPKNFPRWAQACPKSFEEMQKSIARAAVMMAKLPLADSTRATLTMTLGDVAASCWAAGQRSVKEGNLDVDALQGKG